MSRTSVLASKAIQTRKPAVIAAPTGGTRPPTTVSRAGWRRTQRPTTNTSPSATARNSAYTSRADAHKGQCSRKLMTARPRRQLTRQIFSMLVPPGAPMGSPQVMAYTSPAFTTPWRLR